MFDDLFCEIELGGGVVFFAQVGSLISPLEHGEDGLGSRPTA